MQSFSQRYTAAVMLMRSILCVGLDPEFSHVPPIFGRHLGAMELYLKTVIDIAATKVAVVKPQYAYYAALGPEYIMMMIRLVEYAHSKGLLVILDGKRADIGKTMQMYGDEVFGQYGVDACTFVPYLGPTFMPDDKTESWMPWMKKGHMPISMIRTSNPEAAWLQDQELASGLYVYEFLAEGVKQWNAEVAEKTGGVGQVGGVVGATWPEQAVSCRKHAGDDVFFLIPGYGSGQGGKAEGAVEGLIDAQGNIKGTTNSSRGITLDSWYDRKNKVARVGDPIELVAAAIDASNTELDAALEAKLGRKPYMLLAV